MNYGIYLTIFHLVSTYHTILPYYNILYTDNININKPILVT